MGPSTLKSRVIPVSVFTGNWKSQISNANIRGYYTECKYKWTALFCFTFLNSIKWNKMKVQALSNWCIIAMKATFFIWQFYNHISSESNGAISKWWVYTKNYYFLPHLCITCYSYRHWLTLNVKFGTKYLIRKCVCFILNSGHYFIAMQHIIFILVW